jgi:hypothetical protein
LLPLLFRWLFVRQHQIGQVQGQILPEERDYWDQKLEQDKQHAAIFHWFIVNHLCRMGFDLIRIPRGTVIGRWLQSNENGVPPPPATSLPDGVRPAPPKIAPVGLTVSQEYVGSTWPPNGWCAEEQLLCQGFP